MKTKPCIFYESYSCLVSRLRTKALEARDVNVSLSLSRVYGDFRWMNHDGVYQDDELESVVEQKVLQSRGYFPPNFHEKGAGTVLIVSELYSHGGHSSVVMNWMKIFNQVGDHKLIITRPVTSKVEERLVRSDVSHNICINNGVDLVNEILRHTANAERIVLHIHPSDIVSTIAARILARVGKNIIFYNHADHVFTFGLSSATTVCEISSYGKALNNRTGRVKKSCYLGIPIEFREDQIDTAVSEKNDRGKSVISCGEATKYAPGNVFFGDFIDSLLLQEPNVTILLIGSSGREPWWSGYVSRWGDRVQFLGVVSHDKYIALMERADVYVDSFPITGGTAFPEALMNGKLAAGLTSPIQGYSSADELRVETVEKLAERVVKLLMLDSACLNQVANVRTKAKANHSINQFRKRVQDIYANRYDDGQLSDSLVDTCWIESNWLKAKVVHFPFWASIHSLPLIYRLCLLIELKNLVSFMSYKYILRFVLIVIINPQKWIKK